MKYKFNEMRRTGRLKLDKTQTLMHYFFVFVLLVLSGVTALIPGRNITGENKTLWYTISVICLILAIVYFIRQYRSLRFRVFKASLTEQEFRDMFEVIAKDMHWIAEYSGEGFVVATIEFRWSNWGTLITLVRTNDSVMVNSICDLHRKVSTTSWGQNRRNVEAVRKYLEKVNRNS